MPIYKNPEVGKQKTSSFGAHVLNDIDEKNILEFAHRDLSTERLAAQKLPSHCSWCEAEHAFLSTTSVGVKKGSERALYLAMPWNRNSSPIGQSLGWFKLVYDCWPGMSSFRLRMWLRLCWCLHRTDAEKEFKADVLCKLPFELCLIGICHI